MVYLHNTLPERGHKDAAIIRAASLPVESILFLYSIREELWRCYAGGQSEEEACPTLQFLPHEGC